MILNYNYSSGQFVKLITQYLLQKYTVLQIGPCESLNQGRKGGGVIRYVRALTVSLDAIRKKAYTNAHPHMSACLLLMQVIGAGAVYKYL